MLAVELMVRREISSTLGLKTTTLELDEDSCRRLSQGDSCWSLKFRLWKKEIREEMAIPKVNPSDLWTLESWHGWYTVFVSDAASAIITIMTINSPKTAITADITTNPILEKQRLPVRPLFFWKVTQLASQSVDPYCIIVYCVMRWNYMDEFLWGWVYPSSFSDPQPVNWGCPDGGVFVPWYG